jgi:hypothetical protein
MLASALHPERLHRRFDAGMDCAVHYFAATPDGKAQFTGEELRVKFSGDFC